MEIVVAFRRAICLFLSASLCLSGFAAVFARNATVERRPALADVVLAMKELKRQVSSHADFSRQIAETLDTLKRLSGHKKIIEKNRERDLKNSPTPKFLPRPETFQHYLAKSGLSADRPSSFHSRIDKPRIPPPKFASA
jgi:hypothetical protein